MKKKKYTDKQLEKMKKLTSGIYYQAKKEVMQKRKDFDATVYTIELLTDEEKPLVDELYRVKLCNLDTKILEDIINAHYLGQFNRAPITLDAIRTELASRELLGET